MKRKLESYPDETALETGSKSHFFRFWLKPRINGGSLDHTYNITFENKQGYSSVLGTY